MDVNLLDQDTFCFGQDGRPVQRRREITLQDTEFILVWDIHIVRGVSKINFEQIVQNTRLL